MLSDLFRRTDSSSRNEFGSNNNRAQGLPRGIVRGLFVVGSFLVAWIGSLLADDAKDFDEPVLDLIVVAFEDSDEETPFLEADDSGRLQLDVRPPVLRRGTADSLIFPPDEPLEPPYLQQMPVEAPAGFTGQSSIYPSEDQESSHFVPMEDRWRIGMAPWDRYGNDHPPVDDYPFVPGNILDPYNQNVLKGDYPIIGQHTFFNFWKLFRLDAIHRSIQ